MPGAWVRNLVLLAVLFAPAAVLAHDTSPPDDPLFRISRQPVPGGAELLTVTGSVDAGLSESKGPTDVPLVSVLRDTLGDPDAENDRLRYVWVHGFTRPSATQRVASAVPFLNWRTGNKGLSGEPALPPPIIDLADPASDIWKDVMWIAAQAMLFDPYGALAKTSVRAFRRNGGDYRKAHIIRALAVLSLYEADTGAAPVLSPVEMRDIRARLVLAQKSLGGLVDDGYLQRVYERDIAQTRDVRGHNWELLRQRVEAEGLYFEPLHMPDGSATHALVWVARHEVEADRPFNSRFLNIATPWNDGRLVEWEGFSETWYLDGDHRPVTAETPGARAVEMIPLALYGLDHPKIPAVLIDFRDHANPKRREMSRRVLDDVTRHLLSLSPYGDIHYFLGRTVYNFVTGRRGMDLNQPSRLRSYSQLKLLLSLSSSLDPALALEAERLIERVSMNPLQNDRDVEIALAHQSYEALIRAAHDPDGQLPARLASDRRAEYARLQHGRPARIFLRLARVASLGIYRHREEAPPAEQLARLDTSRRLAYHQRFLEEVLDSTPVIEVVWNIEDVRRSMRYLAEHAGRHGRGVVDLAVAVFEGTQDLPTRRWSLDYLARVDTSASRQAVARIQASPDLHPDLRAMSDRALSARADPAPLFVDDDTRVGGGDNP